GARRGLRVHGHPRNEHAAEHEAAENPTHPTLVLARIEDLKEKVNQAADQRHDERRANRHDDVIGQGLVADALHLVIALVLVGWVESSRPTACERWASKTRPTLR